jgi:hypothetical protein
MPGMSNARAQDIFRSMFGGGAFGAGDDDGADGLAGLLGGLQMGGMSMGGMSVGSMSTGGTPMGFMQMGGMPMSDMQMGGMHMGGIPTGHKRRRKAVQQGALQQGAPVRLAGLGSAHLNGERGTIEGFDPQRGRYQVAVNDSTIAVKPNNLQQVLSGVQVVNTSKDYLNGRTAPEAYFDGDKGRYVMSGLSDGHVALRPENILLPKATLVTIEGMQNRIDLNGSIARIQGWSGDRYTVELPSGEQVRLRLGAVTSSLVPVRQHQ